MSNVFKWFELPELTDVEKELTSLEDKIYAYQQKLKYMRKDWALLDISERRSSLGNKLECQIIDLDIRIVQLQHLYTKKCRLYNYRKPHRQKHKGVLKSTLYYIGLLLVCIFVAGFTLIILLSIIFD